MQLCAFGKKIHRTGAYVQIARPSLNFNKLAIPRLFFMQNLHYVASKRQSSNAIAVKWINPRISAARVIFTAQNAATFFLSEENFRSLFLSYDIGPSGPFYIKAVQLITGSREKEPDGGREIKPPRIYRGLKSRMAERYRFARYLRLSTISRERICANTRTHGDGTERAFASGEQEILLGRCRLGSFVLAFPARVIYDRIFARLDNLRGNVLTET